MLMAKPAPKWSLHAGKRHMITGVTGPTIHQSRHLPIRTLLLQSGNGDQPLSQ
jgi:hypothetical protein